MPRGRIGGPAVKPHGSTMEGIPVMLPMLKESGRGAGRGGAATAHPTNSAPYFVEEGRGGGGAGRGRRGAQLEGVPGGRADAHTFEIPRAALGGPGTRGGGGGGVRRGGARHDLE